MNIGVFLNNVISFLIVAFAVFMLVKAVNELRKRFEKEIREIFIENDPAEDDDAALAEKGLSRVVNLDSAPVFTKPRDSRGPGENIQGYWATK